MKDREPRNDIREKRDLLSKRGWVEIQDSREGGRFSKYAEFDSRSRFLQTIYNGASTAGDEYGTFLVWDSSIFEGQSKKGDDQELRVVSELWRKEGWEVRMGVVVDIASDDSGKEISDTKLVAIKRKEDVSSGSSSPSGNMTKKVGGTPPSFSSR